MLALIEGSWISTMPYSSFQNNTNGSIVFHSPLIHYHWKCTCSPTPWVILKSKNRSFYDDSALGSFHILDVGSAAAFWKYIIPPSSRSMYFRNVGKTAHIHMYKHPWTESTLTMKHRESLKRVITRFFSNKIKICICINHYIPTFQGHL
jgi:hypothetical protein